MIKMLVQFVVSGTIVVFATYAAPRLGQKWAGLIVAAPLLTLITFVFLSLDTPKMNLKEYLFSAFLFMIPAAIFILCLYLLANRFHFVATIVISLVIYSVVVIALLSFKKQLY